MHMIRTVPPPLHFEKGKTLFAGLYLIWIISKKQQQLCLIMLHRNNSLIFNIIIFSVQISFNKCVVILLACVFFYSVPLHFKLKVLQNVFILFNEINNYYKAFLVLVFDQAHP